MGAGTPLSSLMVTVSGRDQVRIQRMTGSAAGPVAILWPGFATGAGLYLPEGEGGLARWLVKLGFDLFVVDGRGKGGSRPLVGPKVEFGLADLLNHDLPAVLDKIESLRPEARQLWVTEGWAAPLLHALYARQPRPLVNSMIHIAPYRQLSPSRRLVLWRLWGRAATRLSGYFPAQQWWMGGEAEPAALFQDLFSWADAAWCDPDDGLDYARQLSAVELPRSLYITPHKDGLLYGVSEAKRYLRELPRHDSQLLTVQAKQSVRRSLLPVLEEGGEYPALLRWLKGCGALAAE